MDAVNSIVEWFNGLVGLQYAGYGPITAIGIGMLTVLISIKVLKFFLKPFAPLFQDDADLGQSNPVLAQQGVRHSQMMGFEDEHDASSLRERSRNRANRARDRFRKPRHEAFDALEFESAEEEAYFEEFDDMSADNDAEAVDFSEALEDAWQDDQSTELRAEIAPLRPMTSRKNSAGPITQRPIASAAPSVSTPIIRIENFGETSRSSGAANRMAMRFGLGITETLGRIPNLAIESAASGPCTSAPAFTVEASIELQSDGVRVSLAVRDTSDGSHLMARETTCSPAQMQDFEKEVALEIAAAVIANQRSSGLQPAMTTTRSATQSVSQPIFGQDEQSEKKYPTARRPLLARLRRTDQPTQ